MKAITKFIYITIIGIAFASCESMVEIDEPAFQVGSDQVFQDETTINAAVEGMYEFYTSTAMTSDYVTIVSTNTQSKDLIYRGTSQTVLSFQSFQLDPLNPRMLSIWRQRYGMIYKANDIIEGISNSAVGNAYTYKGEALFMRSWMYFDLINMWGNVPYLTTTAVSENIDPVRTDKAVINQNIIADLKQAIQMLPEDYIIPGSKTRVNKWGAIALLARVYLYTEQWEMAESYASQVINSNKFTMGPVENLNNPNSDEAILQFLPITGSSGYNIRSVIVPRVGSWDIHPSLWGLFEDDDLRKEVWTETLSNGLHYPDKYGPYVSNVKYNSVFRLAEQYLIRAEARAHLNDLVGSREDIDVVRNRAGLDDTPASSQSELLEVIWQERRKELFAEYHHGWFDLKRTGRYMEFFQDEPNFDETDLLWPISQDEMNTNPNLTQNPGY